MEDSPKIPYFAECVSCGKSTFKDLLDKDLRCEYCREVRKKAMNRRTHARSGKKVMTEKK